ncbi:MAG TPA: PD-(D/E)XK nuclease family protein [Dehalococcoidia bacterium]|nr:PD-(D/E)XK nuclease family protein [Dehalococcoidia bacterium]
MSLPELVSGSLERLEAALAERILRAREGRDALAPVTVLIGHALLRPYLRRALALRGVPQINVRFLMPHELAAELAPPDAAPRLPIAVERLLARRAAASAQGYLAPVAGRAGLADALLRLFRELDLGGFTPDGFDAACEAAARGGASAPKLDELRRLYRADAAARARYRAPARDYCAAEAARAEGPLFVYGLWQPHDSQAALIERIAALRPVTLFLPGDPASPAAIAHAGLRDRFGLLAPEGGDGAAPEAGRAPAPDLISAPDTVREVWEAARNCLRWAREGIAFHEMAVIYRNSDPYRLLVDEIFTEAGIPTYLHEGRRLAAHPLGRRVLALLDLAADDDFSRVRVMEFLAETRLPRATAEAHAWPSTAEWESFSREAGIVHDPADWDARLARLADEQRDSARDERTAWRANLAVKVDAFRAFIATLAADLRARPKDAPWSEHLAYVRRLSETYAAGVTPVLDALDDLAVLADIEPAVSFEEFVRAVRDDLERRDVTEVLGEPVRRFGREGVAVLDATSARHLRHRAVCLLGLAERAWPPPPRPDPLLLEHERRALNAAGFGRLPLRTEPDDEALTFAVAIEGARERLAVSYARADAGGSGRHTPSHFFRELVDRAEGRRVPLEDIERAPCVRRLPAGRLGAPAADEALSTAEYDRTLVHDAIERKIPAPVLALCDDAQAHGASFRRAMRAHAERWSHELTPHDGCMTGDAARAAAHARSPFDAARGVSPTALETYAECPYRFFLRYVLGIQPVDEPEAVDRISPLERGSLIHAVLERFMREICPDDPPSPEARARHIPRLLAIADEEGEARERRGVTGKALLWTIDRRQIHDDLVGWYDREAEMLPATSLRPRAFELSFGIAAQPGERRDPASTDEPVALAVDGRTLLLRGRIDRVDWDDARATFRVTDYKTGKAWKPKPSLDRGRALQLPLYVRAAAQALGMPEDGGEARYFYATHAGEYKHTDFAPGWLAARAPDVERVLRTIGDGVDSGYFAPNPGDDGKNCTWCDYKDVCDRRIARIAERKRANDPRAQAYIALEEVE